MIPDARAVDGEVRRVVDVRRPVVAFDAVQRLPAHPRDLPVRALESLVPVFRPEVPAVVVDFDVRDLLLPAVGCRVDDPVLDDHVPMDPGPAGFRAPPPVFTPMLICSAVFFPS